MFCLSVLWNDLQMCSLPLCVVNIGLFGVNCFTVCIIIMFTINYICMFCMCMFICLCTPANIQNRWAHLGIWCDHEGDMNLTVLCMNLCCL